MRTLDDIILDMAKLEGGEKDHLEADALLLEAIEILCPDKDKAETLLECYDHVGKWYS